MSVRSSLRITTVVAALPLALFVPSGLLAARGVSALGRRALPNGRIATLVLRPAQDALSLSKSGGAATELHHGLLGQGTPAGPALTLLSKEGHRALPLSLVGDQEFVALDDLASAFQLTVREESAGAITVSLKGKTIIITPEQALASVGGRLVSLPAPPVRVGRRWLVPVDFIGRVLALVSDVRLDLRKSSHLLVIGDLRVPRVAVRYESAGATARLTIDATPKTTSAVSQQTAQLVVRFDADAIDAIIPPMPSPAPAALVHGVRLTDAATLTVDLGPRFGTFRMAEVPSDTSSRFTIDVAAAPSDTASAPTSPADRGPVVPAPILPAPAGVPTIRTIVIDPGHGGEDDGARGARGTKEKDVALAVARRVKNAVEARLGVRVILTRDDDRAVPTDSRAAVANNSEAELFVSLHANSSFKKETAGATVWCAEFGAEAMRVATAATVRTERLPIEGGGQRDIDLVYWDVAQARLVERSIEFARLVARQLDGRVPVAAQPLERAPLRVLEPANMPAIVVEMGYLSNPDQESQLGGGEFQGRIAQALLDAIVRYRDTLDNARRPPPAASSPPTGDAAVGQTRQGGSP